MEMGTTRINAGAVEFTLQYRTLDGGVVGARSADQGVCIQVIGEVGEKETELLRFDCFDQVPHYHYGPENHNERYDLDKTTAGNPVGWTIGQIRTRLPEMLKRAGYEDLSSRIDADLLATKADELESTAREMATNQRRTVTHNRGEVIIEAGAIRFGLEYRNLPSLGAKGQAIHVLGDVAGQEIEILAFDCFDRSPHYHYGPRNKDERIFWDTTVVPDTLRWTLDQFKDGKLVSMIQRAGYPGIVAELDAQLIQSKLPEVEAQAKAMATANQG